MGYMTVFIAGVGNLRYSFPQMFNDGKRNVVKFTNSQRCQMQVDYILVNFLDL